MSQPFVAPRELAEMDRMYNAGPVWEEGPAGLALSGTGRRGGGRAEVLPLQHVGTAVVSFVLQPEGRADQVSPQSNNLPTDVVSCIERVFRELSFPQPEEPLPVRYPVRLAP